MDKEYFYTENKEKTLAAYCTEEGQVVLKKIDTSEVLFTIDIFGENYKELWYEWFVVPKLAFSYSGNILVVAYGMGVLYFIDIEKKSIIKHYKLFPEVDYSNDSFQEIDMCCYYNEYTEFDFSNSGKYLAVRVRGNYDPQESDGRDYLFTPKYIRSVFVIDMETLKKSFEYSYPEKEESYYDQNMAVIDFSPNDKLILTGALGGRVNIFDLDSGKELASFERLEWISDSCNIDNRKLAVFIDDETFVYVNQESNSKQKFLVKAVKTFSGWIEVERQNIELPKEDSLVMDIICNDKLNKIEFRFN